MKLVNYLVMIVLFGLSGCDSDEQYISYENINTSVLKSSNFSRYIVETCVDIYREKQNKKFNPRYAVTEVVQTGHNNIVEIKMNEVRYVQGSRQEKNLFLYCSRFDRNNTDSILSHRYLDTFIKYFNEKQYITYRIEF
ncbi:hypothetical protein [Photobacterium toruni]|uniref:hypothetical protein n=1 Tax=Photobacterium toruni TaxID=1935446 RepID=UPI00210F6742|nr:hypothetical protein [Photobacterium toruni]